MPKRTPAIVILRAVILAFSIAVPACLYHYAINANPTTASLTFLLIVLAAATIWGLPEAMIASVMSMLCLDYFFYPPVPSFGIDDPQNWVAYCAFLITSFVVSDLSRRMKGRALEATDRQHEIERMYALSCTLMPGDTAHGLAAGIPERIVAIFGCPSVSFYDRAAGLIHRAGAPSDISDASLIRAAGVPAALSATADGGKIVPVSLGAEAIGSLGFNGASMSPPIMQSIANLVAMAMDRARKQEAAGKAEASRKHQELKSMMLDALAHEFQTPLTSIRAGIGAMLAESPGHDQQEWLEIMDQESTRLTAMMAEAIQMARIEAGHVDLDKQAHTVEDLVYSALEKNVADGRIEIDLAQDLPPVSADAGLIRLVLRQLTGNAVKYSRPGDNVSVRARLGESCVTISVSDRGPGISPEEQRRIFEKYYRGQQGRGHLTGMGMGLPIARQIVEAHDGQIWVESAPGAGSTFFFTLPFAHEEINA